jgi:hypothetical protein
MYLSAHVFRDGAIALEKEKEAQLRRPYDFSQSPLMGSRPTRRETSSNPTIQPTHNFADAGMSRLRSNDFTRAGGEVEERRYDEPGVEMKKFERSKEVWE